MAFFNLSFFIALLMANKLAFKIFSFSISFNDADFIRGLILEGA